MISTASRVVTANAWRGIRLVSRSAVLSNVNRTSHVLPSVACSARGSLFSQSEAPSWGRSFSSSSLPTPEDMKLTPPEKITTEMAEGIADATHFYVKFGLARQRLIEISNDDKMPVVAKWQKMMEIFLLTQVHVIAGLGYSADEMGLQTYAQHLGECIQKADPDMQKLLQELRRDTWRELVATCFGLNASEIPDFSIVDARNIMHKVSSKMIEPNILEDIVKRTCQIQDDDPQMEMAKKHQVLQDIIVNQVYLGGSPSIVEEAGCGTGAKGYAKMQCAMSDHEGDPLIGQYATAAMIKIWEAAGLDIASVGGPAIGQQGQPGVIAP